MNVTQEFAHIIAQRGFARSGTDGTYWAGLATNASGALNQFSTMADVAELEDDGYARNALTNWSIINWIARTSVPSFQNNNSDESSWPAVTHLVIVHVVDGTETLAWVVELAAPVVVDCGDSIGFSTYLMFELVEA